MEQRIKLHLLTILQHIIVVPRRMIYGRLLEFMIDYKKVLIEGIIQHYNSLLDLDFEHVIKLIAVWSRNQTGSRDDAELVCQLALKSRALYQTQDQLMQVLSTLPEATTYRFFEEMHIQLTDIDTVKKFLSILPMEQRFAVACKMQHLVTHQEEMDLISSTLDENNKVAFIRVMSAVSCVQRPRLSLAVLLQLEIKIPEEAEIYAVNNLEVLLRAIIQEKPSVEKTKILVKYRTLLIEGLLTYADSLAELTEEQFIAFIYTWYPEVTSGDKDADAEETAVIEKLALKIRRLICRPGILGIVLGLLPESRRSYYLEQLRAFDVNASLPPPKMSEHQLTALKDAKCNIGRLRMQHSENAELMVYLPVTEILAFVRSNKSTITEFADLDAYLCKLKLIEETGFKRNQLAFVRDQFAFEFLHLVSTFDDFHRLYYRLTDQGIKKIVSLLGTHDLHSADLANILQCLCYIRFSNSSCSQFVILKEYMTDLFNSFPLQLRLEFSRTVTNNMRIVHYGEDYYRSHLMTSDDETTHEKLQQLIDKYLKTMETEQAYSQYVFFGAIIALIEPYKQTVESFTAPLDVNPSAFFQDVTPTETLAANSHMCDDQSIIQKTLPLLNALRNQDALNDPISTDWIQQHFVKCLLNSLRNDSCERQRTSPRLVRVMG